MPKLEQLDNQWKRKRRECRVIVETPKWRRNKLRYDPEIKLFELAFILPEGMTFPYDFGFIPSTRAADGDPVDVLVLMEDPADVGCVVPTRLIGVVEAEQRDGGGKWYTNNRLLGVAIHSIHYHHIHNVNELESHVPTQLEKFFTSYNDARKREFRVRNIGGPGRAAKLVDAGIAAYKRAMNAK